MTTSANIRHTLYRSPTTVIDPGSAGSITINKDGGVCLVVTAGAEARTLVQPTKAGINGAVVLKTAVGALTLTVTGGYNADGDTGIMFGDAGDYVKFFSIEHGGSYYWRVNSQEGTNVAGETLSVDSLTATDIDAGSSGVAGTVDVFPTTASKGKLAITCADQTGNTTVSLTTTAMAAARTLTIPDPGAAASFVMTEGAQTINGAKTWGGSQIRTAVQRVINTEAKLGSGAGWTLGGGAVNTGLMATMAASQTAGTLVVPIPGLKVGDTITAFSLVGQIESAGGAVTLDADLRKLTAAAADVVDASVGAIVQIAVTADTAVATAKTGLAEVVAADETFYVLLTGTTAASTDIALQGITVTVTTS